MFCRFFQSCICSGIIDNHAHGLRNAVIDTLNDYTKKAAETSLFSPMVSNRLVHLYCLVLGDFISHGSAWSLAEYEPCVNAVCVEMQESGI